MRGLDYKHWRLYLSRPFTLLGASLWHEWYSSGFCKDTFGERITTGLLIEYPKGVVKYYRDIAEEDRLFSSFDKLAHNEIKAAALLDEAFSLNKMAESILNKNSLNLASAVNFYVKLSLLSTVLPFRVGEAILRYNPSSPLSRQVEKLRAESYYPRILTNVIAPLVQKELEKHEVTKAKAADLITWNEIKQGKVSVVADRISRNDVGETFIYINQAGDESVDWVKDPTTLIGRLEKVDAGESLKGDIAFRGLAKGAVKLILTNSFSDNEFNNGDILVAISTSPLLMPIIKKASAIVTDEGGVTCHAAIISRELKIPCIVGTRNATQVLKDGDLVEVDAERGIVKILERSDERNN